MSITLFPFSKFVPDGSRYGLQELDRVMNALPLDTGMRPLRRIRPIYFGVLDGNPINGAHVHIAQGVSTNQILRPDGDTIAGGWQSVGAPTAALWDAINEESRSDSDYIMSGGAPTNDATKISAGDGVTPGAGNHLFNWRYRVTGYSAATVNVTSINRSVQVATVVTAAAHGLVAGDYMLMAGANQAEYNGIFPITYISTTSFSYVVTGSPATPATGAMTVKRAWWVLAEVLEGTTVRRADTIQTGAVDLTYTDRLTNFSPPGITDYTNVFFRFTATVPGVATYLRPISDDSVGGWTTNTGGTANLYLNITGPQPPDDSLYIQTPVFGVGGSASYSCNLTAPAQVHLARNHTVRYRYYAENGGMSLSVTLMAGALAIASWSHTNITGAAWVTETQVLTTVQRDALKSGTDYLTGLKLKFDASYPTSVASTVQVYSRPVGDYNINGWTGSPNASQLYTNIDEAAVNTADKVSASTSPLMGDPTYAVTFTMGAIADPVTSTGHVIDIWQATSAAGTALHNLSVQLGESGGSVYATADFNLNSSSAQKQSYTLTATEADAIGSNYGGLLLRLVLRPDGSNWQNEVYMVQFSVPAVHRLRVSWAEFELPSPARAEVTWADYEMPQPGTAYAGDASTVIAGSRGKIYSFNKDGTATDLSGAVTYGTGDPGSWHFASFGNHIIATNWDNPVQWRQNNAGNFVDLITSTDKPKARFACAARSHLMLGGINMVGHAADEVWWSAFENPQDFQASLSTQCDGQRLFATPGQVMGMVGGNDPLVFKRNSVYQMRWVGGDIVWQPELISASVGTPYPRSIVDARDEVYWWGGNCFWRLSQGQIQPLGQDIVSRWLMDANYSPGAIKQFTPGSMREEDQIMVGVYDRATGLVIWNYQGINDNSWQRTKGLVYNPTEDRWTALDMVAFTSAGGPPGGFGPVQLAHLVGRSNILDDATHELKGLYGWVFAGGTTYWVRFDENYSHPITIRTKVFPIQLENQDRPSNVRLKGLLPLLTADSLSAAWPDVTVTVEAAQDPRQLIDNVTETYTASVSANQQRWLPFDITGRFFRVTFTFPSLSGKVIRTVDGFYMDWETRGT